MPCTSTGARGRRFLRKLPPSRCPNDGARTRADSGSLNQEVVSNGLYAQDQNKVTGRPFAWRLEGETSLPSETARLEGIDDVEFGRVPVDALTTLLDAAGVDVAQKLPRLRQVSQPFRVETNHP